MQSRDGTINDLPRRAPDIVAVIMSAGASRRFGAEDKRRAPLPSGRLLLATVVANATAVFPRLRVVIRDEDDPAALGLAADTPVIRAPHAGDGLGTSLADAFTALLEDGELAVVEAVAVLLGDMPCLSPDTLRMLRDRATRERIVRPSHAGHPGHPVLFGRDFWGELTALEGDEGARSVIARHRAHCHELEVDDPGIHLDIDVAADLAPLPSGIPGDDDYTDPSHRRE